MRVKCIEGLETNESLIEALEIYLDNSSEDLLDKY